MQHIEFNGATPGVPRKWDRINCSDLDPEKWVNFPEHGFRVGAHGFDARCLPAVDLMVFAEQWQLKQVKGIELLCLDPHRGAVTQDAETQSAHGGVAVFVIDMAAAFGATQFVVVEDARHIGESCASLTPDIP